MLTLKTDTQGHRTYSIPNLTIEHLMSMWQDYEIPTPVNDGEYVSLELSDN